MRYDCIPYENLVEGQDILAFGCHVVTWDWETMGKPAYGFVPVEEQACEWAANKYTGSYRTPHETMGLRIIAETDREDYQFCPNCGKRIKYVEVE